jgi:DNA-binding transcriptional MerR regulator
MTRITELARSTGASVDEIRYLEAKGFIESVRVRVHTRMVREYREPDVQKVKTIIKFRRQGFTWDAAFEKAMKELENPTLF